MKHKPKRPPNSDRFGEDGRRRYSAHDAANSTKAAEAAKSAFIEADIHVRWLIALICSLKVRHGLRGFSFRR